MFVIVLHEFALIIKLVGVSSRGQREKSSDGTLVFGLPCFALLYSQISISLFHSFVVVVVVSKVCPPLFCVF